MLRYTQASRGASSRCGRGSLPCPFAAGSWRRRPAQRKNELYLSLQRSSHVACAVETEPSPLDTISLKTIEDLDTQYCDDFVCTSSPAVEQTVRSLARELTRGRYTTTSLYQPTVSYSDGFRSFTGPEGYLRQRWVADNVQGHNVVIEKMRMLDRGTSQVEWRLTGRLAGLGLDVRGTTTCTHNLLTGRITEQRERWDLSRCSPPAALLVALNRRTWSAHQALGDLRDGLGRAVQGVMGGGAGGGSSGSNDLPSDPTRFFQGGEPGSQDLLAVGFLLALVYLGVRLLGELDGLHH